MSNPSNAALQQAVERQIDFCSQMNAILHAMEESASLKPTDLERTDADLEAENRAIVLIGVGKLLAQTAEATCNSVRASAAHRNQTGPCLAESPQGNQPA